MEGGGGGGYFKLQLVFYLFILKISKFATSAHSQELKFIFCFRLANKHEGKKEKAALNDSADWDKFHS